MLLGLAATTLSGCDSSAPATGAPTLTDARAVLSRHAAAVLDHSPEDYLADVSTQAASAAFRAQERDDIANLARVPLATWSYADVRPTGSAADLAAARSRYGTAALLVQVTLQYALRDVDPLPTRHALYLTLVRVDGAVRLAGDGDLSSGGRTSWAGPWRYGPLAAVRGASSLVLGPPGAPLQRVADAVDAAVPQVAAVWGTNWNRQVAVVVAGSDATFAALVGSPEQLEDVAAAAVTDGVDPVNHRAFGQRLVLAPSALASLTAVGTAIVVRHELTHLATAAITDATTPRWVVEGFAEYVANLGTGQPVGVAAAELRVAVRAGGAPAALPSDSAFGTSGASLAGAYEQAWLACRLIAARAGRDGLVRFYRTVAGALLPAPQALATALRAATGHTVPGFTAEWRDYLRVTLG